MDAITQSRRHAFDRWWSCSRPFPSLHLSQSKEQSLYPIRTLACPLCDIVVERLEGLELALQQLTDLFRDSIAAVIGIHVGDAISDAVGAALDRRPPDVDDKDQNEFYGERFPYSQHSFEDGRQSWHDPEPMER